MGKPQASLTPVTHIFSYLRAHWRGELSLGVSLWINMLGGSLLLSWVEFYWLSYLTSDPVSLVLLTILTLLFSRVLVFGWQLTGLIRSIERDYLAHRDILRTRSYQAIALLTVVFTLVYALEVVQGAVYYKHQLEVHSTPQTAAGYKIELSPSRQSVTISGNLEPGITEAVRSALGTRSDIRAVILDSSGGQVYEGRGLSKLFTENALDTYVYDECSSACTTAFIGGKKRYLGRIGKLGFHRYRLDRTGFERIVPFYDLQAEQARDLALFRSRGIEASFLDSIFEQPSDALWYPDQQTLLAAGVVDEVVTALPGMGQNRHD